MAFVVLIIQTRFNKTLGMKVLIFGASGVGTSTLASEIERFTDFKHLDLDDFYWKKTEPPYELKVPLAERNMNLKTAFYGCDNVVLSGSISTWGAEWSQAFDLAIFMYMEPAKRLERLRKREEGRYGSELLKSSSLQEKMEAFLLWASKYDLENFEGRSISMHRSYCAALECPVIELDGAAPLEVHLKMILPVLR